MDGVISETPRDQGVEPERTVDDMEDDHVLDLNETGPPISPDVSVLVPIEVKPQLSRKPRLIPNSNVKEGVGIHKKTENQMGNRFSVIANHEQTPNGQDAQTEPNQVQETMETRPTVTVQRQGTNQPENRSQGIKVKQKKVEIIHQPTKRQNLNTTPSHPVKKASKPHLEKSQEHTIVVSHSQGIKIGQSISKSPAKVKDSIPRFPPKGPLEPPKAKQKKDFDDVLFQMKMAENIMTDNKRLRRGFTDNDICKRCGQSSESAIHAIRDCPVVSGLWKSLVHTRYYSSFFTSNLQDWIMCNLSRNMGYEEDFDWSCKFGITCWLVWKQRNQWVFNGKHEEAGALSSIVNIYLNNVNQALNINATGNQLQLKDYIWHPPPNDVIKVNVDGSFLANNLAMSCGGVARDCYGNWLYGYSKSLGKGCSAYAELWSIYFGLSTAWDRGYKKVILESESSFVIKLIQDVSFTAHPLKRLISCIRDFLIKDWQVELIHTLREGNYVAHSLAVHAHSLPLGLNWFNSAPSFCTGVYRFDSLGVVPLVGS
ncbi:non-LTR retroelement reverse transcriptase-like [Senna tora]|uniref:Non-LTR retroelement reverse transcriptase-like n=1 Tax=Senna tora TaxID=362788 RepID=A0A834TS09_9FABA|nr:non-LTR retroelement reverse transcriptase-like [Senna tora]